MDPPMLRLISIHAPHARCDTKTREIMRLMSISIHAPHARCDQIAQAVGIEAQYIISIHAPHARYDLY